MPTLSWPAMQAEAAKWGWPARIRPIMRVQELPGPTSMKVRDAVGVGGADDFGEVEGCDGLADDGIGGGFAG